jgi:hypothetical protein
LLYEKSQIKQPVFQVSFLLCTRLRLILQYGVCFDGTVSKSLLQADVSSTMKTMERSLSLLFAPMEEEFVIH